MITIKGKWWAPPCLTSPYYYYYTNITNIDEKSLIAINAEIEMRKWVITIRHQYFPAFYLISGWVNWIMLRNQKLSESFYLFACVDQHQFIWTLNTSFEQPQRKPSSGFQDIIINRTCLPRHSTQAISNEKCKSLFFFHFINFRVPILHNHGFKLCEWIMSIFLVQRATNMHDFFSQRFLT